MIDSIYHSHAASTYRYHKVTYRSSVGDLDIPAYVFAPLATRNAARYPVLVWVHGSVHGGWSLGYLPFVKEAVSRGYVVIAPDYRGATGYGREFYDAIDYGGREVEDVISAIDYARRELPFADADRAAIMGWGNGGLIALLAVLRESHPFRAAIAIGPVSDLVVRLSYKDSAYQEFFTRQPAFGAPPQERPEVYIERSPSHQIGKLEVPLMVHMATNDEDVDFAESQMLIRALQAEKPDLAEIRVYKDPVGGHAFSRMVNRHYQIIETAAMVDTWARTWSFFERHLTRF